MSHEPIARIPRTYRATFQAWLDTLFVTLWYRSFNFRGKGRLNNIIRRLRKNRPLTIRYGQGWIKVTERQYISDQIIQHWAYEPEVWNALAYVAEKDEILWDIGANIGSFSIRAMYDSKINQIHCFEPAPETLISLKYNLGLNESLNKVTVYPFALGSTTKSIDFYLGSDPAINSAARDSGLGSIRVQCYTVDDMIKHGLAPAPTLIKIDVEDWDEDVIRSADYLLSANPPKAIVFEAECTKLGNVVNNAFVEYLLSKGYKVHHIMRPDGKILFTSTTHNYMENYIAIHESRGLKQLVL